MIANDTKLTIVTVNYRQYKMTSNFLDNIRKLNWPGVLKVYVISVGVTPDDQEQVLELSDKCNQLKYHFISTDQNTGFAKGNNLHFKGEPQGQVLYINNDVIIEDENLLIKLYNCLNQEVAVVCPKIRLVDNTIQYSGSSKLKRIISKMEWRRVDDLDGGPQDFFHGACCLIDHDKVHFGWPEDYFLYYEELHYAIQIQKLGFQIWLNPTSEIVHLESVSTGKDSPMKSYYMTRNRVWFCRKNYSKIILILSLIWLYCVAIPKKALSYLVKRNFNAAKSVIKGAYHGLII